MKVILLALLFLTAVLAFEKNPLADLLRQKASLKKSDLSGKSVAITLQSKGTGITDDQEKYVDIMLEQA